MKTKIKICGITNAEDAAFAARAGADFVGLIFAEKSSRRVSLDEARAIAETLGGKVGVVGVFTESDSVFIRRAVRECGLCAAQLHGGQTQDFADSLADCGARIWKVLWPKSAADVSEALAFNADKILIDAKSGGAVGGTGRLSDWASARKIAEKRDIILAGGIAPENAAAAIKAVHPWALDVNSGVEADGNPRKKDFLKIEKLFEIF